jgi:hypothetical protein
MQSLELSVHGIVEPQLDPVFLSVLSRLYSMKDPLQIQYLTVVENLVGLSAVSEILYNIHNLFVKKCKSLRSDVFIRTNQVLLSRHTNRRKLLEKKWRVI